MQNYIFEHSSTFWPRPGSEAFPGNGIVVPSNGGEFIESIFGEATVAGNESFAWVAAALDNNVFSRIDHVISSAGSISVPPEPFSLHFFRCEVPKNSSPNTITWANLQASTNVHISPISAQASYKTVSWRDAVPFDFRPRDPNRHVYYGIVMRFVGSAAVGSIDGYISCREVVGERPVLQPLK